jgi:DNA-binding beta-propeller fold protein YncE
VQVSETGSLVALQLGVAEITVTDKESGRSAAMQVSTYRITSVAYGSREIGVSTSTNYVYVASGPNYYPGVYKVNAEAGGVSKLYTIPSGESVQGLAVDSTSDKVHFVLARSSNTGVLKTVDGATGAFLGETPVPGCPTGVAVDDTRNRIYVSCASDAGGKVAVIDGSSLVVSGVINLPNPECVPHRPAVLASSNAIFIATTCGSYLGQTTPGPVYLVDGDDYSSVRALAGVQSTNGGIAADQTRGRVYVSSSKLFTLDGSGSIINSKEGPFESEVSRMVMDELRNRLFAAESHNIGYLDLDGAEGALHIPVGVTTDVAVNPQKNRVYMASGYGNIIAFALAP